MQCEENTGRAAGMVGGAAMKNPLNRRFPRELRSEFGKYLILFVFLAGMIALVSGFLVASESMIIAYNESFEKYQIEDGNFELEEEAGEEKIAGIEQAGVQVYQNFYIEEETEGIDSTLRIFRNRTEIDLVCLMDGQFPEQADEIAIDRMYADNNGIRTGDSLKAGSQTLKVTGLVALSDYSALFSDTSDMMFDAVKFGVAVMTEDGFDTLNRTHLHYNYSWKYNNPPADDKEAKKMAEDFLESLTKKASVVGFIPEFMNQAIIFTGDDLGGDNAMFTVFLYIVTVIIAFVFAITTSSTIVKEASVIGTLRASGYTRKELILHYMSMPVLVMLAAALVGNVLGYTVFKEYMAGIYYGSYSLPTYVTVWSADAFIKTTAVPLLLLIMINLVMLWRKLSLSPLKFMRRDLNRRNKKRTVPLSGKIGFMTRFRIRIIFQNMPNYVTIFAGIFFANIILLFGSMLEPLLDHFEEEIKGNMVSDYQYVLREAEIDETEGSVSSIMYRFFLDSMLSTSTEGAEKYSVTTLKTKEGRRKSEEITVYGVKENSDYVAIRFNSPSDVYVSDAYAEKHGIQAGDTIVLEEPYDDGTHSFTVTGIYGYPSALAVFMEQNAFNREFDKREGFFNGYFTDKKITDIKEEYIAATITLDDLDKTCRQLRVSMGGMMVLFQGFGIIMFAMIIYLLSKIILEKNAQSISMTKILGYLNGEIGNLYVTATAIVVVVSIAVTIPASNGIISVIWKEVLGDYAGWLPYYVPKITFVKMFAAGAAAYGAVALFQMYRIKKIPMTDALKNTE